MSADDAGGTGKAHTETDIETVGVLLHLLDPGLPAPAYAHDGDAGADLHSRDDHVLAPGERVVVRTGVALALPDGYVGLVHPRSGLAARHGITVVNAPGTVDAGYRGEVLVVLLNTDAQQSFRVHRGDRIAQLVVQRFARAQFARVDWLPDSDRGETGHGASGGFGSTDPTSTPTHTRTDTTTDTTGPRTGQ